MASSTTLKNYCRCKSYCW